MVPTPALRLRGLERAFPVRLGLSRKPVLRGVDLELARGAALGLVGPNGSGKTTLLRLLAGVDRASGGELLVLGGSPLERRIRARLAYLPEDSPFPGELGARAALDLIGALAGLPRRETRARGAELLERVGLAAEARTPLRRFSRGMLRRFGLAQAFLGAPELVLLDEPTAGLDARGFAVIDDLLGEARARGTSVVLASHLASDVHRHCDRLCVLLGGRVAASGEPERLFGVEGRVELEVEGLSEEALRGLERWIGDHGGRLVARRAARASLLELYRTAEGEERA